VRFSVKNHLVTFSIIILAWQVVSYLQVINPMFLPSPYETLKEGFELIRNKTIILDLLHSMKRAVNGVAIAIVVGIPIGLIIGYYDNVYKYLDFLFDFLRSVPPIITFPLALLIFGVGEASRVAVIVFGCTTIMILNTSVGVHNSSKMRVNVAKIMGARPYQIFFRVIIFDAMPQIFAGIRVVFSLGIIIGIVTEMVVGTTYGLGSRAVYAQISYNTAELYVTIILIGMVGMCLNKSISFIENRLVHWKN